MEGNAILKWPQDNKYHEDKVQEEEKIESWSQYLEDKEDHEEKNYQDASEDAGNEIPSRTQLKKK